VLEELQRDIPEDEYLRVPSSDLIDEIVYGRRSND
jgi:hypothetical protein